MISPVSMNSPINNITSISAYRLSRNGRAAMPQVPVTPVRPSPAVYSDAPSRVNLGSGLWASAYHAEQAGRSRVSGLSPDALGFGGAMAQASQEEPAAGTVLPNAYPAEMAARMRVSYPEIPGSSQLPGHKEDVALGAEGAQQAADDGRCKTCEERKYQDGSDDSTVSYQTPTNIDPDVAPAAVRGHELEHVAHEQARAQQEGRKVVSQTVTLHTDICPECGRVYVSGGTTRTVTKADSKPEAPEQAQPSEG